jgi:hypothetical protein
MMPTESQGGVHFINAPDEVRDGKAARPSQVISVFGGRRALCEMSRRTPNEE